MASNNGQLSKIFNTAAYQNNPIDVLRLFLEAEAKYEQARQTDMMRFVGYVLELGYETAKIITSDPYKLAVGGIPRGSFLILTPEDLSGLPLHFTLLRVTGVAPTPLSTQVQQTYFELHKKSMPELDVWTQSELQWGALDCDVLGMFYAEPTDVKKLSFSGDVNNVVSAHRYRAYAPDEALLNLIVNGMVKTQHQAQIGTLRTMECGLVSGGAAPQIPSFISMRDFMGCRTAMFGKTRLGKSNVVKLIAQGMLDCTEPSKSEGYKVGQLIFDINGEYANDNPQDGNKSLRSANEARCHVYALTERKDTPSKPLRLNFYENPDSCMRVIESLLAADHQSSIYIKSFSAVQLNSVEQWKAIPNTNTSEKIHALRKIQMYWAILAKAGFKADEKKLKALGLKIYAVKDFDPHFNASLRKAAYEHAEVDSVPSEPSTLEELKSELEIIAKFRREDESNSNLKDGTKPVFDADEVAMLDFLSPKAGSAGPALLRPYQLYHAPNAGDFVLEILKLLDKGETIILDLGNATDQIRKYFADMLSKAVFQHQEKKFVENKLDKDFIQLYFEEAHNLFPPNSQDLTDVYARFAKEGAKFHIGMVYSTQSPSTINGELLTQTENFFVGHLSSQDETKALTKLQIAFQGIEDDILRSKTPGYMRMLTMSHRFVVPVQTRKFEA
jgi:hypothetical protein